MNSSAQTEVNGVSVFDPIILMEPDNSVLGGVDGGAGVDAGACVVQPVRTMPITSKTARGNGNHFFIFVIYNFPPPNYFDFLLPKEKP
jgi:hypothetical protein